MAVTETIFKSKETMKRIFLFMFILLAVAIPAGAQGYSHEHGESYFGAGFGLGSSTADTKPKPIEFFVIGQQKFGRLHLRGLGGLRTKSVLPALFRLESSNLDGKEIFARVEGDILLFKVGSAQVFFGPGVDYFYQLRKYGRYHSGLNPTASAGVKFPAFGGNHRIAATRIFQEFKARKFPYVTAKYPGAPLIHLQHKGTLNPTHIQGWRASYEGVWPIKGDWSIYAGIDVNRRYYTQCPTSTFCDSYGQIDVDGAARVALVYSW